MNCRRLNLAGENVIVCGHFHEKPVCEICGAVGELLCDWIMEKGTAHAPGRTCDRRICAAHALEVGKDKHLCPAHEAAFAQWKAQREKRPEGGGAAVSEALMLVLLGVLPGAAIGAGLALAIARWRGMFNPVIKPEVKVTISVRPAVGVASMSSAQPDEYTVVVRPQVFVDWPLLYDAARGSGAVVVPKEFAPPQH